MVQLGHYGMYDKALPNYMPNHFLVFYTNDLWKGLEEYVKKYHEIIMEK